MPDHPCSEPCQTWMSPIQWQYLNLDNLHGVVYRVSVGELGDWWVPKGSLHSYQTNLHSFIQPSNCIFQWNVHCIPPNTKYIKKDWYWTTSALSVDHSSKTNIPTFTSRLRVYIHKLSFMDYGYVWRLIRFYLNRYSRIHGIFQEQPRYNVAKFIHLEPLAASCPLG